MPHTPRSAQQEVQKHLALARSAIKIGSVEEARNASYAACRLIIAHDLLVVLKDDLLTFVMPTLPPEPTEAKPVRRRKRQPILDPETKEAIVDAAGDFAGRFVSAALRDVVRGR